MTQARLQPKSFRSSQIWKARPIGPSRLARRGVPNAGGTQNRDPAGSRGPVADRALGAFIADIPAADFQKTQKVWQTRRLCESGKRTERDE